jgi:diguanylate cyclase (GGDEF)-like protein/PAS domain S-box-containing protein
MDSETPVSARTLGQDPRAIAFLEAILEASRDRLIITSDINGYIIHSSVGAQVVLGAQQADLAGKDVVSLFGNPAFQRDLAIHIAACDPAPLVRERLAQDAAGGIRHLDVTLQRVDDAEGRPIGFLCLASDVTEMMTLAEQLQVASMTDELTGLYNQGCLFTALSSEIVRARSCRRNLVVCFLDLDGLKQFNDSYGHLRGTDAIKETARLLRTLTREGTDTCYRFGGDEFVVVMPEATRHKARLAIERLRIKLNEHFRGKLSVSAGIAELTRSATARELVKRANEAMYWAKAQGKNCVALWE